ncbi:MAG: hypothetical protein ACRC1Y_03000 [Paraclostridium sp.]
MCNIDMNTLSDRLDFIEFKQNLLFFKQPNHKATEFANLSIGQFLLIRDFVCDFETDIIDNSYGNLKDFELKLLNICPSIKTYPNAASLVAKILMDQDNYDILFSSTN